MPDLVTRLAQKYCRRCSMGPGVDLRPSWCDCELIKAAIREAQGEVVSKHQEAVDILKEHDALRRRVEGLELLLGRTLNDSLLVFHPGEDDCPACQLQKDIQAALHGEEAG